MGPHPPKPRKFRKIHAIPLDWPTPQSLRHGISKAEHLCIHLHAQLFERLPHLDLGLCRGTYRTELHLPHCHPVRGMHAIHQTLGYFGNTTWILLVHKTQGYFRYDDNSFRAAICLLTRIKQDIWAQQQTSQRISSTPSPR